MASQLKVDTITGVTTAGSIAVTAEGNSTTTNLQQGLCKAWFQINQDGTQAFRDSFNFSSLTDGGTGITSVSYTNNMNNANYAVGSMAKDASGGSFAIIRFSDDVLTTGFKFVGEDASDTNIDCDTTTANVNGDLA